MKTKVISIASLLAIVCTTIIFSCKKKKETTTPASTSADYAGTWNTTSKCNTSITYQMTITASGASGVVLANFHAPNSTNGYTLNGTISDKTITIPSQTVNNAQGANKLTFSGSGTLTPPSSLSITYSAAPYPSGTPLSCVATCTK